MKHVCLLENKRLNWTPDVTNTFVSFIKTNRVKCALHDHTKNMSLTDINMQTYLVATAAIPNSLKVSFSEPLL